MVQYDAYAAPERQQASWNCSCASAAWALQSLGFEKSEADVTQEMLARGLVTPEWGLMDGSGAGLAQYLRDVTGLAVLNRYLSWADVEAVAGQGPICQGSNTQYHWSDIRYREGNVAYLNNPAPGWQGMGDAIDRWAWESWGPWAGVLILPGEDPQVIAELEAENVLLREQNASLNAELAAERSWSSSMVEDTVKPVTRSLDQALQTQRPEDWLTVDAAANSLHSNLGI